MNYSLIIIALLWVAAPDTADPSAPTGHLPLAGEELAAPENTSEAPKTDAPDLDVRATHASPSPAAPEPASQCANELIAPLSSIDPAERLAAIKLLVKSKCTDIEKVLAYVAEHDNYEEVQKSAVLALGSLKNPKSMTHLAWLAHTPTAPRIWQDSAAALGLAQCPTASQMLFALIKDQKADILARRIARKSYLKHYPEDAKERVPPQLSGSVALPTIAGALFGGYSLMSVGAFADNGAAIAVGLMGGAGIGGFSGYLLAKNVPTERSFLYSSAAAWGVYSGWMAYAAASTKGEFKNIMGSGLMGEIIGVGATYALAEKLDYDNGDIWHMNINGIAGSFLALAAMDFVTPKPGEKQFPQAILGTSLTALALTGALTKHVEYTPGDKLLVAYTAAESAYLGALIPSLSDEIDDKEVSAAIIGGTMGLYMGQVIAAHTDLGTGDVWKLAISSSFGKTLGAGAALLADKNTREVNFAQLGMGALGIVGAATLGETNNLNFAHGDFAIVPVSTLIGLWHGITIGAHLDANTKTNWSDAQQQGLILTLGASAGLGAMAASQFVDVPGWNVAMGSLGAVWGGWLTSLAILVSDRDFDKSSLTVLAGSDLALLGTAMAISEVGGVDPSLIAGGSLGGLTATTLVAMAAFFADASGDTHLKAALISGPIGLATGGAITWYLNQNKSPEARALSTGPTLSWWPDAPNLTFALQPWLNRDGEADGMVFSAIAY